MTFGTTEGKPWVEAISTEPGKFIGRTFSRFHILSDHVSIPSVAEIWATSDHVAEAHAHNSDELFYVLRGAIEINGKGVGPREVVFIPRNTVYSARVLTSDGAHVVRIELPNADSRVEDVEFAARIWQGPLTDDGVPRTENTNPG